MPTKFEVVATNCKLAQEILDAGIEAFVANFANTPDYEYICIEKMEPVFSAWQIFLAIYIVLLIPTFISWVVLHRKSAPADQFFILGTMSMILPVIAPIVVFINLNQNAQNAETVEVAMKARPWIQFARKHDADDQN